VGILLALLALLPLLAQPSWARAPIHYDPTIESLRKHPLPHWYDDAKLGIFIHYGLYSVPGWAPLSHPDHDFRNEEYLKNNPYAEWYYSEECRGLGRCFGHNRAEGEAETIAPDTC
jgi:alpha-L-fucosidase